MEVVGCTISQLVHPVRLVAARRDWREPGRPRLLHVDATTLAQTLDGAAPWFRDLVMEFAALADVVLLSVADVTRLYGAEPPIRVARRLRALGARAVFLHCAPGAAVLVCADGQAVPRADGANDILIGLSVTAAKHELCAALRRHGVPGDPPGWLRLAEDLTAA